VSPPRVVAVHPGSPAHRAGIAPGDVVVAIGGERPRDVIRYQLLVDGPDPVLDIERGGLERTVEVAKADGEPLGIEVESAVFDQVRTCDNHCSFCFIYQLPPGLRPSLYLKDDDFRLSFLYGNFTTLTRFTEADLERVVAEKLSPLYVSIHATDPEVRARMLRNRRGATSLRWLRALLDHGITVHGQVVVCPGHNDGPVLDQTLAGVLDEYPELATLAVVPLGVSAHSRDGELRPHTVDEAAAVVDTVEAWQAVFDAVVGRRLVFAADEYYLLAGRDFPPAEVYGEFPMHEDGIGMARAFELELTGRSRTAIGPRAGFFAWVDGAPAQGYRAPRAEPAPACGAPAAPGPPAAPGSATLLAPSRSGRHQADRHGGGGVPVALGPSPSAPVGIITGAYGARVLGPLLGLLGRHDVRLVEVDNRFFGGNIAVTGLLVGADIARVLAGQPPGHRYLLPDVCLSGGRFLDGTTPGDLPRPVEVVPTDGRSLRRALDAARPVTGGAR
jgi:putative radical SAM enzyme (TIGR03279 family)